MAKSAKGSRRHRSRQLRSSPCTISQPYCGDTSEDHNLSSASMERKDYEESTCSVCLEFPHNAVLLLCSSHEKGCHPYMCGTNCHHSNCLDQFQNAYKKVGFGQLGSMVEIPSLDLVSPTWPLSGKSEVLEFPCPLCRGQVKGWTVVEPARRYLNNKKRGCMQNDCSFAGTYKELKKHVKSKHPCAKPREINPEMEEKWRLLELERERQDVISTIWSSMPGSVVLGDYVIDMTNSGAGSEDEAGEGDGEVEGGRRGVNRSHDYSLRERAQLMSIQRDNRAHETVLYGHVGSMDAEANISATTYIYSSQGNDSRVSRLQRIMESLRAGRRRRRRQGRSRS